MNIKFTEEEYNFIVEEFGYSKEQVDGLGADELYDLADDCFIIEEEETVAAGDDGELSERGEIAAGIVTKVNE